MAKLKFRPYSTGYMRGSLAILGSVDAANAKLDPKVNKIVPTLVPLGTLKDVPSPFDAENITASVGAILYSVQQVGQASPNIIVSGGAVVVINGNFILTTVVAAACTRQGNDLHLLRPRDQNAALALKPHTYFSPGSSRSTSA